MTAIEKIKSRITQLYSEGREIHVTIQLSHPRLNLQSATAVIRGIYPHVFRIEEVGVKNPKNYTLQYTDLLTNSVKIEEL